VAAGTFRADLYYRLNVLPIRLPTLRDRAADLEALVDTLAEDIARRSGLPHKSLSADALDLLARHRWPGNIRELRNALEQATLMTDDMLLTPAHFSGVLALGVAPVGAVTSLAAPVGTLEVARPASPLPVMATRAKGIKPLPQAVAELEASAIREALAATGGNKVAASRLLGISRATLYEKLPAVERGLGLPPE